MYSLIHHADTFETAASRRSAEIQAMRIQVHSADSFELQERLFVSHRQCQAYRFAFLAAMASTASAVAGGVIISAELSLLWLGLSVLATVVWLFAAILFYVMPSLHDANRRAEEASEEN